MLRSIGKQSGESVESVRKKKRKATVGKIWKKRKVLRLERKSWSSNKILGCVERTTRVDAVFVRMSHVAWSAYMCVGPAGDLPKRLNQSRCRVGWLSDA